MNAQRIVLLAGLPGSGKSTWLAQRGLYAISSDQVRGILVDDPTNQEIHARVFATMRYLLRQRLGLWRPVSYIDSTNLTRSDRKPWIELAGWYGCEIEILFFATAVSECLRRNALRERIVPPEAIEQMAAKLQIPELGEGFSQITLIRC